MFKHSKYFNNRKGNKPLLHSTRTLVTRNLVLSNRKNNTTTITSNDLITAFEELTTEQSGIISEAVNTEINDNLDVLNGGNITSIKTDTITSNSGDSITFTDANVTMEKDLTVDGNITVNGSIGNFSVEDFKINDNLIYLNMAGTNNTILTGTQMLNPDNTSSDNNKKYIGMIYLTGGSFNSSYEFSNSSDVTGTIKLCYNGFNPETTDSNTLTAENYNYLNNLSYINLDINDLNLYGSSIVQNNSENNINFKIVSDTFFEINSENNVLIPYRNIRFDVSEVTGKIWSLEVYSEHSLSIDGIYDQGNFSMLSFNPTLDKSGSVSIFRNLKIDMSESNNNTDSIIAINGNNTTKPLVEFKNTSITDKTIKSFTYLKDAIGDNSISSEEIEVSSGSFNILVTVRGEGTGGNISSGFHIVGTYIYEGELKIYPIIHLLNDNNIFDLDVESNNNKITLTLSHNSYSGNIYWTAEMKILSIK